jgi:hypothetical protein
MPKAFSLTYGLDLDTELSSFWSWFGDARNALGGLGEPSAEVGEVLLRHKDTIDRYAAEEPNSEAARFALTLAVALVGSHYASTQKLLAALQDYRLLQPSEPGPIFDTIVEPALEEERPR